MKMQNIPLDQIVWNPWRDKDLFPIDPEHVAGLRASMKEHGFFASLKGRRRNGKVELGCGHARFEAAKRATVDGERLETIPIFIGDIDDDGMLRLMTDENALQAGATAGAVLNEAASVTRRLVEVLLDTTGDLASIGAKCFEGRKGYDTAKGKLLARLNDPEKDGGIGWRPILRYLGDGDEEAARRSKRQIIDAISTLKQARRYDDIVNDELRRHPQPIAGGKPAKDTAVEKTKSAQKRQRTLDERTANVFPNDHQFHAFREAVTTPAAQMVIAVEQQLALAKSIMKPPVIGEEGVRGAATRKQIGAPYIKKMVQTAVQEGMKKQRDLNQQEKEAYLREQAEERIESELHSANASLRSLLSALGRLQELAKEFPAHPRIGGFAARLDTLVAAIQQFSKRIK